jgi:hypothetical protein
MQIRDALLGESEQAAQVVHGHDPSAQVDDAAHEIGSARQRREVTQRVHFADESGFDRIPLVGDA